MKEYLFYQNNKAELKPIEDCLKPTVGSNRKLLGKKTLTGALTTNYASFMGSESTMFGSQKGSSRMDVASVNKSVDSFKNHIRTASQYSTPQVFGKKENMITSPRDPPRAKGKNVSLTVLSEETMSQKYNEISHSYVNEYVKAGFPP